MTPDRPTEKSNYSYKEMMDQLRRQKRSGGAPRRTVVESEPARPQAGVAGGSPTAAPRPQKGGRVETVRVEVVKNEDGTEQLAEVRRRRKRRTHQPKKVRERRLKVLKRALWFGVLPCLIGVVALYLLLTSRVGGEGFRESASGRLSELSGMNLEFGRFDLRGFLLGSRKVDAGSHPGTLFQGAEINAIKAELRPGTMLSDSWDMKTVQAADGKLRFGPAGRTASQAWGADARPAGGDLLRAGLGFGLSSDPSTVAFELLHIADADLFWDPVGASAESPFIEGCTLSADPPSGRAVPVTLGKGELKVPGWVPLSLINVSGAVEGSDFQIRRGVLRQLGGEQAGEMTASGSISLRGTGAYALDFDLARLDLFRLVHEAWTERIAGRISGEFHVGGELSQPGSMHASGAFVGEEVTLSNNDILRRLNSALMEARLNFIKFRELKGTLHRDSVGWVIDDIDGESLGLLRLRGRVVLRHDETIEGDLQVGIAIDILDNIEGGHPECFGPPDSGFCWAPMKITGLIEDPRDSLTSELEAIMTRRERIRNGLEVAPPTPSPQPSPAGAGAGAGASDPVFEELIRPRG